MVADVVFAAEPPIGHHHHQAPPSPHHRQTFKIQLKKKGKGKEGGFFYHPSIEVSVEDWRPSGHFFDGHFAPVFQRE